VRGEICKTVFTERTGFSQKQGKAREQLLHSKVEKKIVTYISSPKQT
jgi:hypothetical protein